MCAPLSCLVLSTKSDFEHTLPFLCDRNFMRYCVIHVRKMHRKLKYSTVDLFALLN